MDVTQYLMSGENEISVVLVPALRNRLVGLALQGSDGSSSTKGDTIVATSLSAVTLKPSSAGGDSRDATLSHPLIGKSTPGDGWRSAVNPPRLLHLPGEFRAFTSFVRASARSADARSRLFSDCTAPIRRPLSLIGILFTPSHRIGWGMPLRLPRRLPCHRRT